MVWVCHWDGCCVLCLLLWPEPRAVKWTLCVLKGRVFIAVIQSVTFPWHSFRAAYQQAGAVICPLYTARLRVCVCVLYSEVGWIHQNNASLFVLCYQIVSIYLVSAVSFFNQFQNIFGSNRLPYCNIITSNFNATSLDRVFLNTRQCKDWRKNDSLGHFTQLL